MTIDEQIEDTITQFSREVITVQKNLSPDGYGIKIDYEKGREILKSLIQQEVSAESERLKNLIYPYVKDQEELEDYEGEAIPFYIVDNAFTDQLDSEKEVNNGS